MRTAVKMPDVRSKQKPTRAGLDFFRRRAAHAETIVRALDGAIEQLEAAARENARPIAEAVKRGGTRSNASIYRKVGRAIRDAVKRAKVARQWADVAVRANEEVLAEMLLERRR